MDLMDLYKNNSSRYNELDTREHKIPFDVIAEKGRESEKFVQINRVVRTTGLNLIIEIRPISESSS